MLESQELCLYSDSKWCVDIFSNLHVYKRKGWMVQHKKPVRHHVYNEEADAPAKAGAALSKVHRPRRGRDMPQGSPEATGRKQTRRTGIKRQAVVEVSDDSTYSDRPAHIRHRAREMRNAPLDIPDPEPD